MPNFEKVKTSTLFDISNTYSFNKNKLTPINEGSKKYDYVTRTSENRGILQETGFVNERNLNKAGTYSLGLLQKDFFYRTNDWYAGQFVRKIIPKIKLNRETSLYLETVLNKLKPRLSAGLVRDVDDLFLNSEIFLPVKKNGSIDWDYMKDYIVKIEITNLRKLDKYILSLGYPDLESTKLTNSDLNILKQHANSEFVKFEVEELFDVIKSGKRIKSADRIPGSLPFITAGAGNMGFSSYISSSSTEVFPKNTLTIDMFGNTYYRGYLFGADDHVTVLHDSKDRLTKEVLQYIQPNIEETIKGKYSYSKNFYASDAKHIGINLPIINNNELNLDLMTKYIKVIQKKTVHKLKANLDRQLANLNNVKLNL